MKNYKKKPVIIQAIQWDATSRTFETIKKELGSAWLPGEMGADTFYIETLEGNMLCRKGDYVIKGIKGEFYPCKPDIFEATYEECINEQDKN